MASSNHLLNSNYYHVFLSFRGTDTRKTFTADLHEALDKGGIKTFMDDPDLERGADINPELLRAIEQSRFAVVVLSPNYAYSKWCLAELAHIVKCMKDRRGAIMPVFYGVEPGDVRHQKGSFSKALDEHEKNRNQNVHEWREALTNVGKFSGWTSSNYTNESKLIEDIFREVWKKVNPSFELVVSSPRLNVGRGRKQKQILSALNTENDDVRFIVIHGKSPRGNSTLARLIYDQISPGFPVHCFLKNVGEDADRKSLVYLQKTLMLQMTGSTRQIWDVVMGKDMIKTFVASRKVVLVLDGVERADQVFIVAGAKDWYFSGSRIIITTTRDPNLLLDNIGIPRDCKVEGFSEDESLELSSRAL